MEKFQISRVRQPEEAPRGLRRAFPGLFIKERDIWNGTGILLLFLLLYAGLVLCIGKPFYPDGNAWAVMVIWLLASAGSWAVERVGLPGPLGMILVGIAIGNINNGRLVEGLPASWSKELRAIALAIIFLRSGLELDLRIFKRVGWVATRLLLVPGIVEAFFDGGLIIKVFGMPATFAFAVGFIMKAVGPALVIQCMFEVQQKRLGTAKSIPATVVAAASFDDMIAITGYTIFIDIAVTPPGNQVWSIMHGPLSVVFGILAGFLAAYLCAFTKLWNNKVKRTAVVLLAALFMKFIFDRYGFTSGGALGSLTLGLLVKELWARGQPGPFALKETNGEFIRSIEKHVRWLWRFIMMPILFGLIGDAMRFNRLQTSSIAKACGIIVAGLAVRMPVSFLVVYGGGFTWKERLFFAFAWSPKATVQAALALSAADAVAAAYRADPTGDEAIRYSGFATVALTIAVFEILIAGTLGTLLIRFSAPLLLEKVQYLFAGPTHFYSLCFAYEELVQMQHCCLAVSSCLTCCIFRAASPHQLWLQACCGCTYHPYDPRQPSLCVLYSGCSVLACTSGCGSFPLPCHVSEVSAHAAPLSGLPQADTLTSASAARCCMPVCHVGQHSTSATCVKFSSMAVLHRLLGYATFVLLL